MDRGEMEWVRYYIILSYFALFKNLPSSFGIILRTEYLHCHLHFLSSLLLFPFPFLHPNPSYSKPALEIAKDIWDKHKWWSRDMGGVNSHSLSPFFYVHLMKVQGTSRRSEFRNKSMWLLLAAAAKSLQSCPTLCDSIDGSPPGSPVPGILQARTLEWVAISFSNAEKWKVKVKSLSRVRLLVTPRTAAHQAPPSMGFSRQEYWSGVPLPSPIQSYHGPEVWKA